ncbi:hypothetical protein YC2023_016477 [Brassica napus]
MLQSSTPKLLTFDPTVSLIKVSNNFHMITLETSDASMEDLFSDHLQYIEDANIF